MGDTSTCSCAPRFTSPPHATSRKPAPRTCNALGTRLSSRKPAPRLRETLRHDFARPCTATSRACTATSREPAPRLRESPHRDFARRPRTATSRGPHPRLRNAPTPRFTDWASHLPSPRSAEREGTRVVFVARCARSSAPVHDERVEHIGISQTYDPCGQRREIIVAGGRCGTPLMHRTVHLDGEPELAPPAPSHALRAGDWSQCSRSPPGNPAFPARASRRGDIARGQYVRGLALVSDEGFAGGQGRAQNRTRHLGSRRILRCRKSKRSACSTATRRWPAAPPDTRLALRRAWPDHRQARRLSRLCEPAGIEVLEQGMADVRPAREALESRTASVRHGCAARATIPPRAAGSCGLRKRRRLSSEKQDQCVTLPRGEGRVAGRGARGRGHSSVAERLRRRSRSSP